MRDGCATRPGAAILYHIPTDSTLALDQFGDVDPQSSVFSGRAGLAAFDKLAGDVRLMADLKEQELSKWRTSPVNEPEIRLREVWQDGPITFFAVSIAGLGGADDRFYCPGETWTVGDETFEIASDCMAQKTGTPVSHFFFTSQPIKGSRGRPVQLALDGVPSNIVHVREGVVSQETAVYKAVLEYATSRQLVVRGETVSGFDEDFEKLAAAVDLDLLKNYQAVNESPHSLRFLFQGSSAYSVQPSATIARDYLPVGGLQPACAEFRSAYPGLGGVVTLSRIGRSDNGTQALVHVLLECGTADRQAAYYILNETDDGWQVADTITTASGLPTIWPELVFNSSAEGCGDLFVVRSNPAGSEYIIVSVDARAFTLSTEPITLDLTAYPETIGAWIDVYADSVDKLVGERPYCNDVGPSVEPQSVWQGVSGTVIVSVSPEAETDPCAGEPYQASLLIVDIVFALDEEIVHLPSLSFDDGTVGWCSG